MVRPTDSGMATEMKEISKKQEEKTHWFCYNSSYYKGMQNGDEDDEIEQKKTREFMAKYMAHYGAHRKGMTPEDVANYYTKWADNQKYEQDLHPGIYNGPALAADALVECFPDKRDKIKVLDIACGTGFIGEELNHLGFKIFDGVDPSPGMLKICRKKKLYRNLFSVFCNDKQLPIEDSIYDAVVISGGMGEGHIPCAGIYEMIRVVKPGGFVIILMRKEYLRYVAEYVDRLEPLMDRLEQDNKWECLDKQEVSNYSFNRAGVLFKFRVKKGIYEEKVEQRKSRSNSKGSDIDTAVRN